MLAFVALLILLTNFIIADSFIGTFVSASAISGELATVVDILVAFMPNRKLTMLPICLRIKVALVIRAMPITIMINSTMAWYSFIPLNICFCIF